MGTQEALAATCFPGESQGWIIGVATNGTPHRRAAFRERGCPCCSWSQWFWRHPFSAVDAETKVFLYGYDERIDWPLHTFRRLAMRKTVPGAQWQGLMVAIRKSRN